MKRALLALLMTAVLSAVAFAGPSLNPWFEVDVPDVVNAVPTLEAGAIVEGMLSPSWFIDLGVVYSDPNLLDATNVFGLEFEANIGFDELATVNQTGSLIYGCLLSFASEATYKAPQYPNQIEIMGRTTGFAVEGFVGPLTVWGGVDFPWTRSNGWIDFVPTFGIRVDFVIDL